MRQDELDLIQPLSPTPVLDGRCPTVTSVAKAVGEDNGGRVGVYGREDQGLGPAQASHLGMK